MKKSLMNSNLINIANSGGFVHTMKYIRTLCDDDKNYLKNHLESIGVSIVDLDKVDDVTYQLILLTSYFFTKRKVRNITGFLNDVDNVSYSNSKKTNKTLLVGRANDVLPILATFGFVGYHKHSELSKNDETTSFNSIIDKASMQTAFEIMKVSTINTIDDKLTIPGLIGLVQVLRSHGFTTEEIIDLSTAQKLDEFAYNQYKVRARKTAAASEMVSVLLLSHDMKPTTSKKENRASFVEIMSKNVWNKTRDTQLFFF